MASAIGRTEGGRALWRMNVHGADVRGQFIPEKRRRVPTLNKGRGQPVYR
jgi:hypothetical protein